MRTLLCDLRWLCSLAASPLEVASANRGEGKDGISYLVGLISGKRRASSSPFNGWGVICSSKLFFRRTDRTCQNRTQDKGENRWISLATQKVSNKKKRKIRYVGKLGVDRKEFAASISDFFQARLFPSVSFRMEVDTSLPFQKRERQGGGGSEFNWWENRLFFSCKFEKRKKRTEMLLRTGWKRKPVSPYLLCHTRAHFAFVHVIRTKRNQVSNFALFLRRDLLGEILCSTLAPLQMRNNKNNIRGEKTKGKNCDITLIKKPAREKGEDEGG